jgi:hypothetical protein
MKALLDCAELAPESGHCQPCAHCLLVRGFIWNIRLNLPPTHLSLSSAKEPFLSRGLPKKIPPNSIRISLLWISQRLYGRTAGGDFLCLCDQKSLYEHVSEFGRLRSYDTGSVALWLKDETISTPPEVLRDTSVKWTYFRSVCFAVLFVSWHWCCKTNSVTDNTLHRAKNFVPFILISIYYIESCLGRC